MSNLPKAGSAKAIQFTPMALLGVVTQDGEKDLEWCCMNYVLKEI